MGRRTVFNLIFSGIQAYNQVAMFMVALFFLGAGGLLLGYSLYWRVHAIRASGTIIGVLNENSGYFPVYRYQSPDGEWHEAKSDTGSSSPNGKQTGCVVPLMVSAHNPVEARPAGDYLLEIIGLVMFTPGVWLGYTALTAYPVTRMTWIMGIALAIYLAERLRRILIPKGRRIPISEWKNLHNIGGPGAIDLKKVQPIELLVVTTSAQAPQWQNRKFAAPLLGLFAILLLAGGVYQGIRVSRFETSGMRTQGEVVRMVEQSGSGNNGGYTYYPVVRFHTADNLTVEFKDEVGSNPPTRRPGDKANVIYLPANPAQAMIDRGILNWAVPVLMFAAAIFLVWLLTRFPRAANGREAENPHPLVSC